MKKLLKKMELHNELEKREAAASDEQILPEHVEKKNKKLKEIFQKFGIKDDPKLEEALKKWSSSK